MPSLDVLDIPTKKVKQLNKKGLYTLEDVAMYFPKRYEDYRQITPIRAVVPEEKCALVGQVIEVKTFATVVKAIIQDKAQDTIEIIWFNQPYIARQLRRGVDIIFCGTIQWNEPYQQMQMVSPMMWGEDIEKYQQILPIYSKVQGMSEDYLLNVIDNALLLVDKEERLMPDILDKYDLMGYKEALEAMHHPTSMEELQQATDRFIFQDLFVFSLKLSERSQKMTADTDIKITSSKQLKELMANLPFELTEGQKESVRFIYRKMTDGERVQALVQGDVGSGKTMVAILLMLILAENGYQSSLMTPTNVLARQHYNELKEQLEPLGYKIGLLTGDMKVREKKKVLKAIESRDISMIVGTHAVIQKDVVFHSLGLSIVDEEHRFGVTQRETLAERSQHIHSVTMSATPIPRTLALSLYGNMIDVLSIKTMPKGRKPVKTVLSTNEPAVYEAMARQIAEGRQAYVVCPLIEKSKAEAMADVDSVDATYEKMVQYYQAHHPHIRVGKISGRMKQADVNTEIKAFQEKEYDIIISTTIIEVGVNVPNASVILIKNAERFGLAQLHQLRGRVGRGNNQSYCVLLSKQADNPKLTAMCETTDGFKIAEKDLVLRGTGSFVGTKQSGDDKYVMLMLSYPQLYERIKEDTNHIVTSPELRQHYYLLFNTLKEEVKVKS